MGSGIKMDIFPHHPSIFHYFMKRLIAEEFFRENSQFLIEIVTMYMLSKRELLSLLDNSHPYYSHP